VTVLFSTVACSGNAPNAIGNSPDRGETDHQLQEGSTSANDGNGIGDATSERRAGDGTREWCDEAGEIVAVAETVIPPGLTAGDPIPPEVLDAIERTWVTVSQIGRFELEGDLVRFPYVEVLSASGKPAEGRYDLVRVQPSDSEPVWVVVDWELFIYCDP